MAALGMFGQRAIQNLPTGRTAIGNAPDQLTMNIFEVSPEDIEQLSDRDLRTLVAYVAEREIARTGNSPVAVTHGGHQNAADGGIDVRVDLSPGSVVTGYVPRPQTGFQVKAEDMARADILKEMAPKGKLRPSIIKLGKSGGAYIIVSSKGSVADTQLSARRNAMAEAIAGSPGVQGLHLDFYDRRRLATWVNQNPGLVPWVRSRNGKPFAGWQPFGDWSSSPGKAEDEYLLDSSLRLVGERLQDSNGLAAVAGIDRVRGILREANGVVRLVGLSGVGKTRFVQALFDNRIGSDALSPTTAVYADVADAPDPLPIELITRLKDLGQSCVLVIDNCGIDLHKRLSARVRRDGAAISLITVEYDITDDEPEGTDVFRLEPASAEVVERILLIRHPKLSEPERHTIAKFSEGNSRIALALADTARHGESLATLKDSELFKRLFQQNNADDPKLLKAAKICSLVYSFEGETIEGDAAELPILALLSGQTIDDFHGHVAELHRRQLIQKRGKWRALLPHALAHRLAKEALEDLPDDFIQTRFMDVANDRLIRSFSRRLGYLHDSQPAQKLVRKWLETGGWLADTANLSELGLAAFDNIAPANPDAILGAIRGFVAHLDFVGRPTPVTEKVGNILRSLAYEPSEFPESAELLATIAIKEEPSNSSSGSSNIFSSLFYMYLSGTHANAETRAALLVKLAKSGTPAAETLAMRGLDSMMESAHFTSAYRFEFGTRKRDYGWHPQTQAEVNDWIKSALSVCERFDSLPPLRARARTQFGKDLRNLALNLDLSDDLIAIAKRFNGDGGWPEGWAAAKGAANALRRAAKGAAKAPRHTELTKVASKFKRLSEQLQPNTLSDKIASYILPERWSPLDVTDAEFDDDARYAKAEAAAQEMCKEIGGELAATLALEPHLSDLLRCKSRRVGAVFFTIAQESMDWLSTWNEIADAYAVLPSAERESGALCGFAAGLAEKDTQAHEALLDDALARTGLHDCLVRMHITPKVSPTGALRLVKATKLASVPAWTFTNLQLGRCCDGLTGAQFGALITAICAMQDGVATAIEIVGMRAFTYHDDHRAMDAEDREAGRKLLLGCSFTRGQKREASSLARIVKSCLAGTADEAVAEKICVALLDGFATHSISAFDYGDLIGALAREFPRTVLDILVERGHPATGGRHNLFQDFRETRACPLDKIDDDTLIDWASSGPEERFVCLANTIRAWRNEDGTPNDEDTGSLKWTPAALRVVAETPDPLPVLSAFLERFRPWSWSGSIADILASRLPLLDQLEINSDPRVAAWARRVRPSYEVNISQMREREEKDIRVRDERFE